MGQASVVESLGKANATGMSMGMVMVPDSWLVLECIDIMSWGFPTFLSY
jgi:hypothetical protein